MNEQQKCLHFLFCCVVVCFSVLCQEKYLSTVVRVQRFRLWPMGYKIWCASNVLVTKFAWLPLWTYFKDSNNEVVSLDILFWAYIVALAMYWAYIVAVASVYRIWALQTSDEHLNSKDYETKPFTEQITLS